MKLVGPKVKFKDGDYAMVPYGSGGKKIHQGLEAFPGTEWMKMEITEKIFNGCDCYPWREVFAWLPVKTINGKYVWMRKVYKQKYWAVWGSHFHMSPVVEYGTVFDILTHEK